MNCAALTFRDGLAGTLGSIDCATSQTTTMAFDRLFGSHGMLTAALTIVLTIYVALLAFNLLTGRSTLGLSMLTPKALTFGLVLTFATSWVAYQQVVWSLASGAPDQIASILIETNGSATSLFAHKLDQLFASVTQAANAVATTTSTPGAADQASAAPPVAAAAKSAAPFTPPQLLWVSAMLLMLGTAGVLIVAKIALAAMLAVGPIFIVMALFSGTRGFFEGWLKTTAWFALAPLFTVLVGFGALTLMAQPVAALSNAMAPPTMQQATGIFLLSVVYVVLMAMSLKAASMLTGSWHLPVDASPAQNGHSYTSSAAPAPAMLPQGDRIREMLSSSAATAVAAAGLSTTVSTTTNIMRAAMTSATDTGQERVKGLVQVHAPTQKGLT